MSLDKKYEEIGHNFRFFANWRNLLFGGFIVILGTLIFNTTTMITNFPFIGSLLYTFVALLSLLFQGMDNRIRDLYHGAIQEGINFEIGKRGFFTSVTKNSNKITHSSLLDIFYFSSTIFLLIISHGIFIYSILRCTKVLKIVFPSIQTEIIDSILNCLQGQCTN